MKKDRLWCSADTKKALKTRAAREGLTLMQLLEKIAQENNKEKRRDDYRFF